ncbi:MAG: hypothetical protein SX243_12890 [Acidobacteriota bacterium]|nr:hypothetical protein [Acidobacteriota bacterium]
MVRPRRGAPLSPEPRADDPAPGIEFDPRRHLSPYRLFRWFREGRPLTLLDLRPAPVTLTFAGAQPYRGPQDLPAIGLATGGPAIVLFDHDGARAAAALEELPAELRPTARMLFGGIELYEYCLDPAVVGGERYLRASAELGD